MPKLTWKGSLHQSISGPYKVFLNIANTWTALYLSPYTQLGACSTREAAKKLCQEHFNNS